MVLTIAGKISGPGELFKREALPHLGALFTMALHLTLKEADARELCRQTMLRAYDRFHQVTPATNRRVWLLAILYDVLRSGFRPSRRGQNGGNPELLEYAVEVQSCAHPGSPLFDRLSQRDLNRALQGLPEELRDALLLVDVQELRYEDVARVLHVTTERVRCRVSRARALMRAALQQSVRRARARE